MMVWVVGFGLSLFFLRFIPGLIFMVLNSTYTVRMSLQRRRMLIIERRKCQFMRFTCLTSFVLMDHVDILFLVAVP